MSPVKTDSCLADSAPDPPVAPAGFMPPAALFRAMLAQVECVASIWPAFADLRAAASASKPSRLRLVVSAMVCEARLIFAASYLVARGEQPPGRAPRTLPGSTLHHWILTMLSHGGPALCRDWHWTQPQLQHLHAQLSLVVAPSPWTLSPVSTVPFSRDLFTWTDRPVQFPAALTTFLHALRAGAPWAPALDTFADLPPAYPVHRRPGLRDPALPCRFGSSDPLRRAHRTRRPRGSHPLLRASWADCCGLLSLAQTTVASAT